MGYLFQIHGHIGLVRFPSRLCQFQLHRGPIDLCRQQSNVSKECVFGNTPRTSFSQKSYHESNMSVQKFRSIVIGLDFYKGLHKSSLSLGLNHSNIDPCRSDLNFVHCCAKSTPFTESGNLKLLLLFQAFSLKFFNIKSGILSSLEERKARLNLHQRCKYQHFLQDLEIETAGYIFKNNKLRIEKDSLHNFDAILKGICILLGSFSICYIWKRIFNFPLFTIAQCHSKHSAEKSGNLHEQKYVFSQPYNSSTHRSQLNDQKVDERSEISLQQAIEKAENLLKRKKVEAGAPGIVVGVSIDGKFVFAKGFGHADVENQVLIHPHSVLRIASISKAMTAVMAAKLVDEGHLDMHKSVYEYVPNFPPKEFHGEKVDFTVCQLLTHTSGIRAYLPENDPVSSLQPSFDKIMNLINEGHQRVFYSNHLTEKKVTQKDQVDVKKLDSPINMKNTSRVMPPEYYSQKVFNSTEEALEMISNDRLWAKPGTRFIYSTLAYTLLTAVLEAASKKPFPVLAQETFKLWGLKETYLDQNDPLIFNRARSYARNGGCLINVPYVDVSYKWAGGGFLSSVMDIVKFGNILLYSSQHADGDPGLDGYLKQSSLKDMWTPIELKLKGRSYGQGFELFPPQKSYGMCSDQRFLAGHTGAAVGVSSAVFILPRKNSKTCEKAPSQSEKDVEGKMAATRNGLSLELKAASSSSHTSITTSTNTSSSFRETSLPQGVVVAVIVNLIDVNVREQAEEIAKIFDRVRLD